MTIRIAAGGIHIESSTFTPYISNERDFRVLRGEALRSRYPRAAEFTGVELVPLIHARALPGGIVSRAFAERWKREFLERLQAAVAEAPLDGLLFDIHGAMSMEDSDDAEGEFLEAIRGILGDNVCISVSMDLHGNVSDKLFAAADLLTCYRTAPHIDEPETRLRAFTGLIEIIKRKRRHLVRAKVDIPILLPGEKTSTEVDPGKRLYAGIPEIEARPDIQDCALWMGYPWADQPRCHAAVVVSGYDRVAVEEAALELADAVMTSRDDFAFVAPAAAPNTAINRALAADCKPFFISDTGDNPGAGGADDMVVFLREFLEEYNARKSAKRVLFVSIKDEDTVREAMTQQAGSVATFALGGKIDPAFGGPFNLAARVTRFFADDAAGQSVVLSVGNVDIAVTSNRHQFSRKAYFEHAGVGDFSDYDIIVVKMGYLEPDLSRAAADHVMALTPGAVDQNIEAMPFKHLREPLYPRQKHGFKPLTVKLTESPEVRA